MMKALAGTGALVRLILRRDRIILLLWVLVLAVTPVLIAPTMADLYPTAAERQTYADTLASNPAFLALYGPAFGSSLGAIIAFRLQAGTILAVGIATLLTVVRHTRAEEQAGRRELLGATAVGRQALLFAALLVACGASLLLGVLTAGGLIAYGLPAAGSVAFGLSWAMFGWIFAGIASVAAQLAGSAGAARGISLAFFAAFLVLRVAGDAGGEQSRLSWLSWVSPLGWTRLTRPFADERQPRGIPTSSLLSKLLLALSGQGLLIPAGHRPELG